MSQNAEVRANKSIYMVWIIPMIAMALACGMIFKYYDGQGYEIKILFSSGEDFSVGKTPLIYNGVKIGQVSDIDVYEDDITKALVTVSVQKRAILAGKEGNVFWKVEPKVSLTEISGLSTILNGVYITLLTTDRDPSVLSALPDKRYFEALDEAPIDTLKPGLRFTLVSDDSGIKNGAPLLFQNINIGNVEEVKLEGEQVHLSVYVEQKYAHLVKNESSFWEISGVEIRASLAGLRINIDSLASMIVGGIELNSPEGGSVLPTKNKKFFKLYESYENTLINEEEITLVSKEGYNIDAKSAFVYFRGTQAGVVKEVTRDVSRAETIFKIQLNKDYRHLANEDAFFWIVKAQVGLTEIEGLDALSRGPYISFDTQSSSEKLESEFTLHAKVPPVHGLGVRLYADRGFNLKDGVNVVYHDIIIGSLRRSYISTELKKVVFDLVIAEEYRSLVNDSSIFYIQGAIEGDISMDGIYLNIGSLSSMLHSGIVLETLDENRSLTKGSFDLLENHKAYKDEIYTQDGGIHLRLRTDELSSIQKGSPLVYKGIEVGRILDFSLNPDSGGIDLDAYIQGAYKDTLNASSIFYNRSGVKVNMSQRGLEISTGSLKNIITGGIAYKTPVATMAGSLPEFFELYADESAAESQFIEIRFTSENENALASGSAIVYKGIPVGQISEVNLVGDKLVYDALIEREYEYLLVGNSLFWVEEFEFNIDEVKNAEAILSGAFVKVLKGDARDSLKEFLLLDSPPAETIYEDGLRLLVTGSRLSSLGVGSPVFYRQVRIGSVESYRLSTDSTGVELQLFIQDKYRHLVRENSIFYNATALGMNVSLFGVKVSTETLSTLIHGGITMVVPDRAKGLAAEMQEFRLEDDVDEDWLEYRPELLAE